VNTINSIINAYLKHEINFTTFKNELAVASAQAIANGESAETISQRINQSPLLSVLSESQLKQLKQIILLGLDNEKTLIKNSDDITKVTEDNSKTRVQTRPSSPLSDLPDSNDKTRLQSTAIDTSPNINEAATIVSTPTTREKTKETRLEPGAIINNRFVLERLLGRGGMGSVFKARDLRKEEANDPNSHIAIKFLNDDFKQHPQALISLQREAKKSQTLAHPNIITVHDFDRDGNTVYMTMEYLDGAPLDEYLLDHKHTGIEKNTAIKIIDDLSRALSYAHQKNIVHSDFKPGNVFITKDGTAKVLDFGIARAVKNIGDSSTDSGTENHVDTTAFDAGDLGGLTPAYASCEMLEGKEPSPSDDIYALACVAYQLLTGKHPFGKIPATEARDKKLTPPALKQLDKKQAAALLHAVQFSKAKRCPDAQTFIREFFVRKHTSKGLIVTLAVAGLLLAGVGIKFFLDYQNKVKITQLVSDIQQGDNAVIANAIPTLKSLQGETRKKVLAEVRPIIIQYYAKQSLPLADQNSGNYNYPKALAILNDAKQLYPDSAQANTYITELKNNQNKLLKTLALQIEKYLKPGNLIPAIVNNDIQDIADLLKTAAPHSQLLKDPRLQLAYVREIKTALSRESLEDAKILAQSGLSIFNNDKALLSLKNTIEARETQRIEDQKLLSLQKQLQESDKKISEPARQKALTRHTERLNKLIASGFKKQSWINAVLSEIAGLDIFSRNESEKQPALREQAAILIINKAKSHRRNNRLPEARNLIEQASKIAPELTALIKEKRALKIAERKQKKIHASQEKNAEIAALRQRLISQAKSNDVNNAVKTLKELKKRDPDSPFVKTKATQTIANAYLRLAQGLADRKKYSDALKLADAGVKIAPQYIRAEDKKQEYLAHLALIDLNHALENIADMSIKTSKKQLATIKSGLPNEWTEIENSLAKSILQRIEEMAQSSPDQAKRLIDIAQNIFPNNQVIGELTKRSSKFQSIGGQPCKKSYAGHGKRARATCFDMISNTIKAPLMIVVPENPDTASMFAISKYEISNREWNQYCQISKKCRLKKASPELPATQISATQIQQYLSWISAKTGQQYQLPTDEQWWYAANANGKHANKDVNCRLMLGSKQIKGINLLDTKSGKHNAWGLKHYIGNVQELVLENNRQNNTYFARGGAYTDDFSQCNINLKRKHSGKADAITGFRILKELTGKAR